MQTYSKLSITAILGLFLCTFSLSAQHSESKGGMAFHEGTWAEVLEAAQTQQKLIFVDAFTDWCGPCKAMSRNTFPDASVGEYYNANFINFKLDMEKGEGPDFAAKYEVNAYPTLLYINYQGEVVQKVLGYRDPKGFLDAGKKALDPENSIATLKLKYESGSTDPEVLYTYGMLQYDAGQDFREAGKRYFATQEDKELMTEKNWEAIQAFTQGLDSREFQYLLKKRKKFGKRYGMSAVESKIAYVCRQNTVAAVMTRNNEKYDKALAIAEKYLSDDGKTASRLQMTYFGAKKDWKMYAERTIAHFNAYPTASSNELNSAAWNFYLHVDDAAQLEKAADWSRQSVAIDNAYYNNDTHASVLYKMGRYKEALKAANKAIGLARMEGQDPADTEKLADKIRAELN